VETQGREGRRVSASGFSTLLLGGIRWIDGI
jgi:hypothetical protein